MTDTSYRYQRNVLCNHHAIFPLANGKHAVITEFWDVPRSPMVGESGTEFDKYAIANGTKINSYKRDIEVGA
jgi:hypothetical protein